MKITYFGMWDKMWANCGVKQKTPKRFAKGFSAFSVRMKELQRAKSYLFQIASETVKNAIKIYDNERFTIGLWVEVS